MTRNEGVRLMGGIDSLPPTMLRRFEEGPLLLLRVMCSRPGTGVIETRGPPQD